MLCPECGAEVKEYFTTCSLCGKIIDREEAFKKFMAKGDEFFKSDEIEKAIISYNRALDYKKDSEDIYIKLGNAYMKKNDKKAATCYLKALSYNFYNDVTHNFLITFYSRFNKLEELKSWYIQNKNKFNNDYIDKFIKIIENTILFTTEKSVKIGTKDDNFFTNFKESIKSYLLVNVVSGVMLLLLAAGFLLSFLFKINISFFLIFIGVFSLISLVFITYKKMKSIKNLKKTKETQIDLENILKEIKKD